MYSVMAPRCSQLLVVGHTTRSFLSSRAAVTSASLIRTNNHNNQQQQQQHANTMIQQQQRCMSSSSSTTSVSGATDHIVSSVQSLNGVHFMSIDQLR